MESKKHISILAALILIFVFIICACSQQENIEKAEVRVENRAFVVESGPQKIGSGNIWKIKDKESGQTFVYVDGNGNGFAIAPFK